MKKSARSHETVSHESSLRLDAPVDSLASKDSCRSVSLTTAASIARWSLAAATGLSLVGCPDNSSRKTEEKVQKSEPVAVAPAKKDKNCCMGLNECKGKGGCAVPESNACAGKNDCKGKGGCNMHCPK